MLELQCQLHLQLTGESMGAGGSATVASQRQTLQSAAAGKVWLVILDDVWQAQHERSLNFVDDSTAPLSRVFVTTRFTKLLTGYVEVALGLLGEHEAVDLLLRTAEFATWTDSQAAAARKITKLCGNLPLFITVLGRLIFEHGGSWETEVVAMLEEDRQSVLVGTKIVSSSLEQMESTEARELFRMLSVVAEDVRVPMPALELIWCAHRKLEPPLSRVEMMKLRRCVIMPSHICVWT